ncbi:1-acyl-sn-glycerol-3-phosphate acyltransferase [Robiginitalea myxolifaciens]|uniref:1-acyl-sn-glycerol-3-phosphate acyltransferase n=1 Tax=Robiginitalea myxolifaciens TaxID=400055 RepID=A0A1I6FZS0_9FLAO|nr:lysophospholipid acyltransferase family protein [Robiginitalea myxolifaciens]SFR35414.1 1-acyl-sn-glycerol-3-phosphate acyltransferase [Robiginitalea myxolifaciens]
MAKLLAYPLTVIYLIFFGLTLVIFHPIQWFCLNVLGYHAHKRSVSILNLCLMRCTHLLGTRYSISYRDKLPENGPLIIVTNHQSMYDIPPIIWHLRKFHPKFVSKKELGKGIPSVSYNLRHGGSALIDRKDRKQAREALEALGRYIEETGRSAVIFPEGTRSRNGVPKPFKTYGLQLLMEQAPSASILPISINNSWKMFRYGKFPHGLGAHIRYTVHPAIPVAELGENGLETIEKIIVTHIKPEA